MPTFAYEPGGHSCFPQPIDAQIKLWRYMPLTKLVSMLDTRSLHFARADTLSDTFEGSGSRATALIDPRYAIYDERQRNALLRFDRRCAAINCWHMKEHESAAMWDLYSNDGIAVQSTFERYVRALPQKDPQERSGGIYVGMVNYIDYDREHFAVHGNSYSRFMHKRKSFSHEREVRGVIVQVATDDRLEWDEEVDAQQIGLRIVKPGVRPDGIVVNINVELLVERIYVAPTTPDWAFNAIAAG
jgi:hypothetical protein